MKFSRRDFIHAGCSIGAATLVANFLDVAEAGLIHRSPLPSGKNQMGLNGLSYFSGINPIANWFKTGSAQQFNVTCAGAISALTAALPSGNCTISVVALTPAVFTAAAHNLYPGASVTLSTTGALPSPFATSTTYFVADYAFTANTFSLTASNSTIIPIIATTSGSGTQSFLGVWSAYATTSGSHGLYQADTTGGVGLPYQNSFWPMGLTCAGNTAYSKGAGGGFPTFVFAFGMTSTTTFAYPLATNADPGASSGLITWSYQVLDNIQPNVPSSAVALNGNNQTFLDSNGDLKANAFLLATQVKYFRVINAIDSINGALPPPGYSRNGETFCTAYTPLGGSPIVNNFTFVNWTQNLSYTYTMGTSGDSGLTSLATPPRDMYWGPRNLYDGNNGVNWLAAYGTSSAPGPGGAGLFEPAYIQMLQATCGSIRFMDWMQTAIALPTYPAIFNYAAMPPMSSNYWSSHQFVMGSQAGLPLIVLTSLANAVNKHPWINIPCAFKGGKSARGTLMPGSPASFTTQNKHNFINGDTIILYSVGGSGIASGDQAGWGVQVSVTINVGTAIVTYTSHSLLAGQPVVFQSGTLPSPLSANVTFFVCNNGNLTTNTFQLSTTYANAIAGTAISMTGSASSVVLNVPTQRTAFQVGAVTDTTMVLSNLSTTNFGTAPTSQCLASNPYVQAEQEAEITSLLTEIQTRLRSTITPFFEYGNENWNTIFTNFSTLNAWARNFTNSGTQIVGTNQNKMAGYCMATVAKKCRDIFGGGAQGVRPWKFRLGGQLGNNGVLSDGLNGIRTYLTTNSSALLVADLLDDVSVTSYTGVSVNSDISIGTVTFTAASPGTITDGSGKRAFAGMAVVVRNSGGSMPVASNGLNPGGALAQQNAASPQVSITGTFTNGTVNVTAGSGIVAGMTVYGTQTAGVFMNSVVSCVIQAFGTTDPNTGLPSTGAGGTGTYVTDSSQTLSSRSLSAYNPTLNSAVYYLLNPISPYEFTDSVVNFNAAVNTSGVMTVSSFNNLPQAALAVGMVVFQPVNGFQVNPTDISAGLVTITGNLGGNQWQLSASPAVALPLQRMGAGTPLNLSSAGTGTFTLFGAFISWVQQMMVQSKANWIANPGTYPSQYTYYNQQMGFENIYGQATNTLIQRYGQLVAQCTSILATGEVGGGTLMPAVGLAPYEGGPGSNPQGSAPNGNSTASLAIWREYGPQACGTTEEAASAAALWATVASLPGQTYDINTPPTAPNNVTIPASFRITYLPKFVDAVLPSTLFQFGSMYVVDSNNPNGLGSIGSPSILNGSGAGAYPGPWYAAMQATN